MHDRVELVTARIAPLGERFLKALPRHVDLRGQGRDPLHLSHYAQQGVSDGSVPVLSTFVECFPDERLYLVRMLCHILDLGLAKCSIPTHIPILYIQEIICEL